MELIGIFVLVLPFVIGYKIGKQAGIKQQKITSHIDSLPEKREERPGVAISNKPPLTGKGQFDKQRTTYTEGDNT
tara:strand:+ start:670 stop:894 length:225 start_codon:yes stop_codon:yes gene_type:complete